MGENNGKDTKKDILVPFQGSPDLWVSRLIGGGLSGLVVVALWMVLPSVNTYLADQKQIRLMEIQSRLEQLNQQLTSCVSDLKDARAELRVKR